jgi:hypothetical protein
MENLALVSSSKMAVFGCNLSSPKQLQVNSSKPLFGVFRSNRSRISGPVRFSSKISARANSSEGSSPVLQKLGRDRFAWIGSSSKQTSSVGVSPPVAVPPPSSQVGSPLFWIGVGVALSAVFSWVASSLKKYAMQQAMKAMMGQMNVQQSNNQFTNSPFSPGSPFPFPPPPQQSSPPFPFAPPPQQPPASQPNSSVGASSATVDVSSKDVESPPSPAVEEKPEVVEEKKEPKKSVFVDVSPDETVQASPYEKFKDLPPLESAKDSQFANQASQNGAAPKGWTGASEPYSSKQNANPPLSVEALEKMLEDPAVQKMVYPYLPEEMRNPTTFKWMLQNPQYRQQLQDMLNNMGGNAEWDNRMMDSLKSFDLSSPEVKQQFDQIGLTPEEVISKIMANPDVAMAFQNPRVQAAIMDCSQNPMSIAKYQNDKEVMDVFNKISELFPGVAGSP